MKKGLLLYVLAIILVVSFCSCSKDKETPALPANETIFSLVISSNVPLDSHKTDFYMTVTGVQTDGTIVKYKTNYNNPTYLAEKKLLIVQSPELAKYGSIKVTSAQRVANTGVILNITGTQNPDLHLTLTFYSDNKEIYKKNITVTNETHQITWSAGITKIIEEIEK